MVPEPKVTPPTVDLSKVNWSKWALPAVLLLQCSAIGWVVYDRFKGDNPAPAPVVETVKFTVPDTIAKKDGIRDDSVKVPLVDLANRGNGTYTVHFQPDGKAEDIRTVTVTGGFVPPEPGPKPPLPPPKPPEPGPSPPVVDPNTKVTAVTYVYEKDQNGIPNHVSTALNKINRESNYAITATIFEDDSTTGGGNVPAQYKAAYEAAKKEGLPVLVVTAGDKVLRSVKAPKTEQEILEAAR